ncbi:MAG: putative hydrolase [Parcubacteria group bacterium Athens0416_74]|nr:MAG: putative hydrolase [Parcubacteria group bacterium Athens0416_74]
MKYVVVAVALIIVAYAVYQYVRISRLVDTSEQLVNVAKPFSRSEGRVHMLVLGDSTAVGVGSNSEETVAGRLSSALDASIENYAMSGARTRDIAAQFSLRQKGTYDIVLIQIGANDVIRFTSLEQLRDDISLVLKNAKEVSDRVVLLTAGRVGDAPFFPRAFGWLWTYRASQVRSPFLASAEKYEVAYVDLYTAKDPFSSNPTRFYAPDGLHLTGDGYGFWYEEVSKVIESKWPGYLHER